MAQEKTHKARLQGQSAVTLGICFVLFVLTWLVFGQTLRHEFINYDDETYVYENPQVISGLSADGIARAFTWTRAGNWHPLTWLSHMLDCELFGLNAGGHHFTNVLLHSLAVVLLFLALRQMTGAMWRSAFVAALFAIHPLRVESVAWVAERKDVLSGVFFMLTLVAYLRYVRERGTGRYLLVLLCFALGLLSKPMLVTLPLILLLLDYWPLDRFNRSSFGSLMLEKVPLLTLSLASSIATLLAQKETIAGLEYLPWSWRLNNAFVSYVIYLWQLFWPVNLTVLYPHTGGGLPFWIGLISLGLLIAITVWTIVQRKKFPSAFTGWLWYLIMLLPVIGLVQVGSQAHADRYTYLPQIGLYLLIAWSAPDRLTASPRARRILASAAAAVIVAFSLIAWWQTSYWKNSEALWQHALAVDPSNYLAENNLGNVLLRQGLVDEAVAHYEKALALWPGYDLAHYNLGNALLQKGETAAAIDQYRRALTLRPTYAEAENNLGEALLSAGSAGEAVEHYQTALQLKSGRTADEVAKARFNLAKALLQKGDTDGAIEQWQQMLALLQGENETKGAEIHYNLGNAYRRKHQVESAIAQYRKAIELRPTYAEAHYNLANALTEAGQTDAAVNEYRKTLALRPDYAEAHNNLGNALLEQNHAREAITEYELAAKTDPRSPIFSANLASAYAAAKDWTNALTAAKHALQLTPARNTSLIQTLKEGIDLYQRNTKSP